MPAFGPPKMEYIRIYLHVINKPDVDTLIIFGLCWLAYIP